MRLRASSYQESDKQTRVYIALRLCSRLYVLVSLFLLLSSSLSTFGGELLAFTVEVALGVLAAEVCTLCELPSFHNEDENHDTDDDNGPLKKAGVIDELDVHESRKYLVVDRRVQEDSVVDDRNVDERHNEHDSRHDRLPVLFSACH